VYFIKKQNGVFQLVKRLEGIYLDIPLRPPTNAGRRGLSFRLSGELGHPLSGEGRFSVTEPTDDQLNPASDALVHSATSGPKTSNGRDMVPNPAEHAVEAQNTNPDNNRHGASSEGFVRHPGRPRQHNVERWEREVILRQEAKDCVQCHPKAFPEIP
jgi:hypothetical protein